jgi:glycosyltransferase involved in cell wall biosynthesis
MESLWDTTKVLLMPSLWCEAWGLVVVEAQIRGVPVIASDAGAIPEAKLGVPYVIPVNKISGEREGDHYSVKSQNIDPWVEKLRGLMTDRIEYERVSDLSREVTASWVADLPVAAHERWLIGTMRE